jgi:hypothetical protein
VNSGGKDSVFGGIGRVLGQEEGANLVFRAKLRIDVGCIANSFLDLMFLSQTRHFRRLLLGGIPHHHRSGIRQSNSHRSIQR